MRICGTAGDEHERTSKRRRREKRRSSRGRAGGHFKFSSGRSPYSFLRALGSFGFVTGTISHILEMSIFICIFGGFWGSRIAQKHSEKCPRVSIWAWGAFGHIVTTLV